MSYIRITEGVYRNRPIKDVVFQLVDNLQSNGTGRWFVMVDGTDVDGYPPRPIKIFVEGPGAIEFVDAKEAEKRFVDPLDTGETDQEILDRINERFAFLTTLVDAADTGKIRGMIFSGPPGVGKSYEVEQALQYGSVVDKLSWNDEDNGDEENDRRTEVLQGERQFLPRYEIVKGSISAIGLYCLLHKYSNPRETLVLDDCDGIFDDLEALNILKAALDTGGSRWLSWRKDSHVLKEKSVPEKFKFQGTVIFITNADFEHEIENRPNSRRVPHFEALLSRCHYLDLTMRSMRERVLRVQHVQDQCSFLGNHGCDDAAAQDVMDFMREHAHKLREVSLRSAIQIAEKRGLAAQTGTDWKRMVSIMDFKKAYRNAL